MNEKSLKNQISGLDMISNQNDPFKMEKYEYKPIFFSSFFLYLNLPVVHLPNFFLAYYYSYITKHFEIKLNIHWKSNSSKDTSAFPSILSNNYENHSKFVEPILNHSKIVDSEFSNLNINSEGSTQIIRSYGNFFNVSRRYFQPCL